MREEFEMVGEFNFFLSLQVKQSESGIFISQYKYAKNLMKMFALKEAKNFKTPMSTTLKLSKDESGISVDLILYTSMISSLLNPTGSCIDICHSISVCARYQSNPKESHITILKRIIRYVSGTLDYGICYSKDSNVSLAGFSDTDWAGNADDKKSTSGCYFYSGNNQVS